MLWKPGQWKWMPVRHTETQQHPDWVLYFNAEDGTGPQGVAQCEREPDGRWRWFVQAEMIGGPIRAGFEPSADTAMKSAAALIKKEWEARA